jgi:hypothetical protein
MAFVEKREGKRGRSYRVRVRDPYTGELHSETFSTRKAAQDWLHGQESAKRTGNWRNPDAGKVALGTLVDSFFRSATDLAPATLALYGTMHRRYIAPSIGRLSVGAIRPQDLREWTARLVEDGTGTRTTQVARKLVGRVLGQAVADGVIPSTRSRSPLRLVRPGRPSTSCHRRRFRPSRTTSTPTTERWCSPWPGAA